MAFPQRTPLTPADIRAHAHRLKVCMGQACLTELHLAFGTSTANALEQIIEGDRVRRDESGRKIRSHKYRRYGKGAVPEEDTIERAMVAACGQGVALRLHEWHKHALWQLLRLETPSLAEITSCLAALKPSVRSLIFDPTSPRRADRMDLMPFDREQGLALKANGSLDALVALLARTREAELLEEWYHFLAASLVLELFPTVVANTPHLLVRWPELYALLDLAIWRRVWMRIYTFPALPSVDAMQEQIRAASAALTPAG